MMFRLSIVAATLIVFAACKKEDTNQPLPPTPGKYTTGTLILNEGNFGSGNGTVAWYNPTDNQLEKDIFINTNGFPVGNVLFSATANQATNRVYLVVNNSQKIQVAKLENMENVGEIVGFSSPRYIQQVTSNKAYVTDWVSNTVAVVNLSTNTIDNTIAVGAGPERMAISGSRAIIANSGGFGVDSTITVININNDQVTRTEVVGDNPNSLVFDANGLLWVLCGGINDFNNPANSTAGKLVQIDPATFSITKYFDFSINTMHPTALRINKAGTVLYWLDNNYSGNVMEMNISAASLPVTPKIAGSFYNMNVHPVSDEIYTSDALDYVQDGIVYRYDANGVRLDSLRTGIIPGDFLFN
jgi:YVTN family beta-propeller protein